MVWVNGQRGEQLDPKVGVTGSEAVGEQHVRNDHTLGFGDRRHERVGLRCGKQIGDQLRLDR